MGGGGGCIDRDENKRRVRYDVLQNFDNNYALFSKTFSYTKLTAPSFLCLT